MDESGPLGAGEERAEEETVRRVGVDGEGEEGEGEDGPSESSSRRGVALALTIYYITGFR